MQKENKSNCYYIKEQKKNNKKKSHIYKVKFWTQKNEKMN